MKVIWHTAMSMDGRIATAAHDLAFLETIGPDSDGAGHETEFTDFLAGIDSVLVGGSTMRWLISQGMTMPATGKPTWVLSRDVTLLDRAGADPGLALRREGDISAVLDEIEAAGHEQVWLCGGGDIAGQALAVDAVDEVIATIAPTALGNGPALFDAPDLPLLTFQVAEVRRYGANAVRIRWVRDRDTRD